MPFLASFRLIALVVGLLLVASLSPLGCKGEEAEFEPPDERLTGTWFSQEIPGATMTLDLDTEEAVWRQRLIGSFDPTTSPNELEILGTTYRGMTPGLNDNGALSPPETYADAAYLAETYPASSFDVDASDRYVWWQHLAEESSLGVRYTSALPTFFFFEMPFLLTQTDEGRVHGNAEFLHFDGTLGRFLLPYSLDTAGPRPSLTVMGFVFEGKPGGLDVETGSPWVLDERDASGLLARLDADEEFLRLSFEFYVSLASFLPPIGPLWGLDWTYRYDDNAVAQQLELIEYEPFQRYQIREIDDGTFSLRLALWTLAEGHSAWTVPTEVAGQTGLIFLDSPNPLTGLGELGGVPLYTPLGEVDGVVGAWVNPDSGTVVTFSADGRWASSTGANGHWREDGERVYYAEERMYQR